MKIQNYALCLLGLAAPILLAGCNQPANPAKTAEDTVATPAAEVGSTAPAVPSRKVDAVNPADLEAGLAVMKPRLLKTVDALNKVEPLPSFRYFMHPQVDQDASIEFDTTGLASLTLSPFIGDLSGNPDCYLDPAAGMVQLSWTLDGSDPTNIAVDRNYNELVSVDVSNSKTLSVNINAGNEVVTCDWLGLGFLNVKAK